jgi:protein subunit release factor A
MVTGFFSGKVTTDKAKIGTMDNTKKSKTFNFELNQVKESHIGIIFRKNRALYE